jgi:hypothetical protein
MHTESSEPRAADGSRLERAIVLQLLSEDGERRWSRTELSSELDVRPAQLEGAVQALRGEGVLCVNGLDVWASPAVRRLDDLDLICV